MRGLRESPWAVAGKRSTQLPPRQPASTLRGLVVWIFTPQSGFGTERIRKKIRGPFRRFKRSLNYLFFNTNFVFVKDKTLMIS